MTDSENKPSQEEIDHAIKIVLKRIDEKTNRLIELTKEDADSLTCEGLTTEGYYGSFLIKPQKAAEIMLRYDFPVWDVLMMEAPMAMWEELGRLIGIETMTSIDID